MSSSCTHHYCLLTNSTVCLLILLLSNAGLLVDSLAEHATAASRRQPGTYALQCLLDSPCTFAEAIQLAEALIPEEVPGLDLAKFEDFKADFDVLVKLADMLVSCCRIDYFIDAASKCIVLHQNRCEGNSRKT